MSKFKVGDIATVIDAGAWNGCRGVVSSVEVRNLYDCVYLELHDQVFVPFSDNELEHES